MSDYNQERNIVKQFINVQKAKRTLRPFLLALQDAAANGAPWFSAEEGICDNLYEWRVHANEQYFDKWDALKFLFKHEAGEDLFPFNADTGKDEDTLTAYLDEIDRWKNPLRLAFIKNSLEEGWVTAVKMWKRRKLEENLRPFFIEMWKWVEDGNQSHDVFKKCTGLCRNYYLWREAKTTESRTLTLKEKSKQLDKINTGELRELFNVRGLNKNYPFNDSRAHYESEEMKYENQARLAFIRGYAKGVKHGR